MKTMICLCALLAPLSAQAWEADTHAGLTERAALASTLHRHLAERFARPLGLYDPLRVGQVDPELGERLRQLDPEGGFAPELSGTRATASALGWLVTGAVLEGVPAARGRHHFYDPVHKVGLQDGGPGLRTRILAASNGIGSVRGIFTGANFDGNGMSALQWLVDEDNAWGIRRWRLERLRAVQAPSAAEREAALARALLCAGAILHLLEDLGEPAHVHNDYRVAFEHEAGRLPRLVLQQFGRDVPAPGARLPAPARLDELFDALAARTARRFYSPGALPPPGVPAGMRVVDGYLVSAEVAHVLKLTPAGWAFDDRVRRDYADALLPDIGATALTALEHLFAGRLDVRVREEVRVRLLETPLATGRLEVYVDDANGARRRVLERALGAIAVGDEVASLPLPAGAHHLAVLVDGVASSGEPLVISQEVTLLR